MQIREAEKACREMADDAAHESLNAQSARAALAASQAWEAAAEILSGYQDGATVSDRDLVQIFRHVMFADSAVSVAFPGVAEPTAWAARIADLLTG